MRAFLYYYLLFFTLHYLYYFNYVVIIIPSSFILSRFIGAYGVWHAFWITEAVTALFSYIMVRKILNRMP